MVYPTRVSKAIYAFLFPLVFLPGTIQAADAPAPVTLSRQAFVFDVPFIKQETPRQCGLAASQMICSYYQQEMNKTQVDWMKNFSKTGAGLMGAEVSAALRAADYETAVFAGTLSHGKNGIYYHLDRKRPLMVMITAKDQKSSHYDILRGYDPKKGLLLLLDPASGPMTVLEKDFEPAWKRANHFTLLAIPKKIAAEKNPAK